MKCPYCLSPIEAEALVCKTCTKDLYILKPLMARIQDLEDRLAETPDRESAEQRIISLESTIEDLQQRLDNSHSRTWSTTTGTFFLIPLVILLLGHLVITVVYDLPLIYLRILSIVVPLPFGFVLFSRGHQRIGRWLIVAFGLGVCAALGMSAITGMIDSTDVLPGSTLEWKEFLEYSLSMALSFLTGMLLGGLNYLNRHRNRAKSALTAAMVSRLSEGKLSPKALQGVIHNLNQFGTAALALSTTLMSIYTGLKDLL